MGASKTTFARELADVLKVEHIDLDDVVERTQQKAIDDLFAEAGEESFRGLESSTLRDVISRTENVVISLGGGTPCSDESMKLVNESGHSIYLKLPKEVLLSRLQADRDSGVSRPLLHGVEDLKKFIGSKLGERERFYLRAHTVLDPRYVSAEELLEYLSVRVSD